MMKNSNVNGQVLSEQEMREVMGGTPFQVESELITDGKWKYCPACSHQFTEDELADFKKGNIVKCSQCGGSVE